MGVLDRPDFSRSSLIESPTPRGMEDTESGNACRASTDASISHSFVPRSLRTVAGAARRIRPILQACGVPVPTPSSAAHGSLNVAAIGPRGILPPATGIRFFCRLGAAVRSSWERVRAGLAGHAARGEGHERGMRLRRELQVKLGHRHTDVPPRHPVAGNEGSKRVLGALRVRRQLVRKLIEDDDLVACRREST